MANMAMHPRHIFPGQGVKSFKETDMRISHLVEEVLSVLGVANLAESRSAHHSNEHKADREILQPSTCLAY